MQRRTVLKLAGSGAAALAVAGVGGAVWLSGAPAPIARFVSFDEARRWLDTLVADASARSLTAWPLAQVLEHAAQSVEFSMHGFPQPKSAAFQNSVGRLAFAAFERAGAMTHGLTEPIPGAPALVATEVGLAADRLRAAFAAFEAHTGPLAPHFAYGPLDKARYTRAHLLHLADHAGEITPA